jgi:hypothetical protein
MIFTLGLFDMVRDLDGEIWLVLPESTEQAVKLIHSKDGREQTLSLMEIRDWELAA